LKFGRKKIGQSATEEYVLTAKYSISFVLTKINYSDFFFTLESLRCGVFILKNIDSALSPLFLGFSRTQENVGKTFFRGKKKENFSEKNFFESQDGVCGLNYN